ncbi:efflux RND transporter permease subunit [Klebsiella variicola subsp. variicola]|nr:efflux RND transporter permease subunit [Klebsiella variicola subsp. variicola]
MRIWMDPNKLNNFQLTPVDVISALKAQNAQVAAGQLGGTPPVKGQQLNASIIAQTSSDQYRRVWQHSAEGEPGRFPGSSARCRQN